MKPRTDFETLSGLIVHDCSIVFDGEVKFHVHVCCDFNDRQAPILYRLALDKRWQHVDYDMIAMPRLHHHVDSQTRNSLRYMADELVASIYIQHHHITFPEEAPAYQILYNTLSEPGGWTEYAVIAHQQYRKLPDVKPQDEPEMGRCFQMICDPANDNTPVWVKYLKHDEGSVEYRLSAKAVVDMGIENKIERLQKVAQNVLEGGSRKYDKSSLGHNCHVCELFN